MVEVLLGENQALWTAHKWSISQRFNYFSQLSYPSDVGPVAVADVELWQILETVVEAHTSNKGRPWLGE